MVSLPDTHINLDTFVCICILCVVSLPGMPINPHTCMYVVSLFNMHINSYTFCPDRDMSGNDTSVM